MSVNQYKIKYLSKKVQIVLFMNNGKLVESCDTLLNISKHKRDSLFDKISFLESIQQTILKLKPGDQEIYFPRVEITHEGIDYVFDFTFFRDESKNDQIVWMIQDLTEQYKHLYQIQLERNQSIVRREQEERLGKIQMFLTEIGYRNQLHELKQEFFAQTSNYIKKPLQRLRQLYTELEEHYIAEQRTAESLRKIDSVGHKLSKNIDEILKLSTFESAPYVSKLKSFNLRGTLWCIFEAIHESHPNLAPINLNLKPEIPTAIWGDELHFSQLYYNLLSYCATFNSKISLSVEPMWNDEEKNILLFTIENYQLGKSPNWLNKLFESSNFYEPIAENSRSKQSGKLQIIKQLTDLSGGSIHSFKSDLDRSELKLIIPFSHKTKNHKPNRYKNIEVQSPQE